MPLKQLCVAKKASYYAGRTCNVVGKISNIPKAKNKTKDFFNDSQELTFQKLDIKHTSYIYTSNSLRFFRSG